MLCCVQPILLIVFKHKEATMKITSVLPKTLLATAMTLFLGTAFAVSPYQVSNQQVGANKNVNQSNALLGVKPPSRVDQLERKIAPNIGIIKFSVDRTLDRLDKKMYMRVTIKNTTAPHLASRYANNGVIQDIQVFAKFYDHDISGQAAAGDFWPGETHGLQPDSHVNKIFLRPGQQKDVVLAVDPQKVWDLDGHQQFRGQPYICAIAFNYASLREGRDADNARTRDDIKCYPVRYVPSPYCSYGPKKYSGAIRTARGCSGTLEVSVYILNRNNFRDARFEIVEPSARCLVTTGSNLQGRISRNSTFSGGQTAAMNNGHEADIDISITGSLNTPYCTQISGRFTADSDDIDGEGHALHDSGSFTLELDD